MKIKTAFLENIRSHVKTTVSFEDGFNCIVGGLGRGKSSILYAVDFALFGDPLGRSYNYLLREGSDIGKIGLKFVKNGREYTVWRALRRHNERISQDMEQLKLFDGDKLIAEMRSEAVSEQIVAITGIDKDLFREVVWMRQEHLKDLLDMPPSGRQRRLDQLFGLSDYETAWANLRPVLRWYEGERSVLERDPDIVRIKDLQAEYDEAVKSLSQKEIELENLKHKLSEAEAKLNQADAEIERLKELQQRNEELKRRESELQAKIMTIEDVSARLADEIQSRERRIRSLEERLESLRNQEEKYRKALEEIGLPPNQTVEQLQQHMEILVGQMAGIQGEREAVEKELKTATQRISTLLKENRCPLCLQTLSAEYKQNLLNQLYQETEENKEKLTELDRNAGELHRIRSIIGSTVSNLQVILTRIEETRSQLEVEKSTLREASREFEGRQREEGEVRAQLASIRRRISEFDVAKLREAQRLRNEAFDRYSNIKYKVQSIENEKRELSLRMNVLKERLDAAEQKVDRIIKVKKILQLAQEIRGAYRSIQPKLRNEFITYLERIVQQELDELTGPDAAALAVRIDENYSPIVESEGGHKREVSNLSGGERTLLAFAYRIGIGQLIMQARVGQGLPMLILDEPTESLGREDGSIERLAEAISRLKTIAQVIAVTHSEAFAEKADHVIRLEKEDNVSTISIER